jgi:spore coat protein CotH
VVTPGLPNGAPPVCEDPLDWVFEDDRIHDLRLYVDPAAWATLETSTTFSHVPAPVRLVFDGGEFPIVELELKGGYGSFRADLDTQKTAFKVDLNAYEDHEWHGLERLTLDNMVQDPTFTHAYLTFALFREAGVPAPLAGFARVSVNDVPFGLYALTQPVDDEFLDDHFADGSGHLVESAYGPDFDPGDEILFEYDEGADEATGRALLAEVSTLLASSPWDEATYATLRTLVDMDNVMRNMAVEAATWHWDGYTTENNYYLYEDPTTGLWTMIPHGTDQTWVDGWPNPFDYNDRPILYHFCLQVPSCLAAYDQSVLDVADALDRAALEPVLDRLIALTEPEFALETRAEETGDRGWQLDYTRARIQTAAQALRDLAAVH